MQTRAGDAASETYVEVPVEKVRWQDIEVHCQLIEGKDRAARQGGAGGEDSAERGDSTSHAAVLKHCVRWSRRSL